MRVLWLCNIMLPTYAKAHDLPFSVREGWLTGCLDRIMKQTGSENKIELGICFPASGDIASSSEVIDGITYYGFSEDLDHPEVYDGTVENRFHVILDDFKPDILHLFGAEFPHSLAMLRAFGNPKRSLLGIQGLCCKIAEDYMANLPLEVQQMTTFRDRLKNDSIVQQQEKYKVRAEHEREAILLTGNITGRTDFDRSVTSQINPEAKYYPMNETMRPCFYDGKWNSSEVLPHSIFLSQGDYPLKGLHFMIEAMPKTLEKYPDAHLYVAGNNIIGKGNSKYPYFMRASAYGKYLKSLLFKYKLKKKVTMLGTLTDTQMKEQFLKSSVFVCPSIVENSPNSLCEAMLLGMPVVAARAGGIPSLVQADKEGVIFEKGDSKSLADGILQIFDEPVIAGVFGDNARKRALLAHDPDTNYKRLIEIYSEIAREK